MLGPVPHSRMKITRLKLDCEVKVEHLQTFLLSVTHLQPYYTSKGIFSTFLYKHSHTVYAC